MRRMIDPTKVGGLPSTIEFDKEGNRKVKKNLGVDGKLTLKSLVSGTNPDGDITKELGGGSIKKLTKDIHVNLKPKEYVIGDIISGVDINTGYGKPVSALPPSIQFVNGIEFMGVAYQSRANEISFRYICIKGGTLTEAGNIVDVATCWYI